MNEPKRAEEEIQLSHIVQWISTAATFQDAIAAALRIGEVSDWDYGEAWIPSQDGTVLELSPVWYRNDTRNSNDRALEQFRYCSEGFIFPAGSGLPGRVWLSQQSEWIEDASAESEAYFLRNQIAKAFGIRAGFGVPVLAEGQVRAVLVFFMSQVRQEDRQLVEIGRTVARQLSLVSAEVRLGHNSSLL